MQLKTPNKIKHVFDNILSTKEYILVNPFGLKIFQNVSVP